MSLGDNIRYLRISHNYSQDDIAERLGYKSYTTVQKWESGVSEPPVKILKELATLFNVDMDDLANKDLVNPTLANVQNTIPATFLACYNLLNERGKAEAEKRISELTQLDMYVQDKKSGLEFVIETIPTKHIAIAAHNDHAAEPEEQEKMLTDISNLKRPE